MSGQDSITTRPLYYIVIIVATIVTVLFFASPNANYIWPIGVLILIGSLSSIQIATFHLSCFEIVRPFLFSKGKIQYEDVISFRINPSVLTTPPMIIVKYHYQGKTKKIGLPLHRFQGPKIKKMLLDANPKIKEEHAFGPAI